MIVDVEGPLERETLAVNSSRRICAECNAPLPPHRKRFCEDKHAETHKKRRQRRRAAALRAFGAPRDVDPLVFRIVDRDDLDELLERIRLAEYQRENQIVEHKSGAFVTRIVAECFDEETRRSHHAAVPRSMLA